MNPFQPTPTFSKTTGKRIHTDNLPGIHGVGPGSTVSTDKTKPTLTGHHKDRAHSENRTRSGMKLEVHQTSENQYYRTQSGTKLKQHAQNSQSSGTDQFSVFQPRSNMFGTKTQSMQNLSDVTGSNKTKTSQRFNETTGINRPITSCSEKKIDYRTITRLSKLEPSEIIMTLAAPKSGFKEFLSQSSIDFPVLEDFLKVLNIAIGCTTSHQNLIHLLRQVQGSLFLKQVLPFHILDFERTCTQENKSFSVIEHTAVLLKELVNIFPSSSFTEVIIVETLLQKTINDVKTTGKVIPTDVQQKLDTLHKFLQHLHEKKHNGTLRFDNDIYIAGNRENLEEDIRNISIYPTYEDIYENKNPYIRPNIVNKSYPDAKSYLETHFRLLREDFIRPLRDGISHLVTLQSEELVHKKIDDIRIYINVQILSPICTRAGIVHEVKFDITNLSQVRWENSRRLLYGALVCLSKDNFQNMFFATVADRNATDLQKGVITLMFTEESRQKLAEHALDDTFLMVEATAYFEAYRHVLEGLKEMVDNKIPFQKYIVHCKSEMSAPLYLSQNMSGYSLEKLITNQSSTQKQYHFNQLDPLYTNKFDVLNFNTWPTKEELDFDQSQFEAFQMSLTSELSIVQGPPGTGKTYVGLKIVYALLANAQFWKTGNSPILIVCYTNHALDQFLEGILKYTNCKIVRVGSRSNSEILQKHCLSNIRKDKNCAYLPGYLRAMHAELNEEKNTVQRMLNEKAGCLKNANKGILLESTLESHIPPTHFTSLMAKKTLKEKPPAKRHSVIVEWLGVAAVYQSTHQTMEELTLWERENIEDESDFSKRNVIAVEEETDEDFIKVNELAEQAEDERMIDEDYDLKQQIMLARMRAAKAGRETLAFVIEEHDSVDEDGDNDQYGWQITNDMKKKLKKLIKCELQKTNYMEEKERQRITDLWQLQRHQRWQLYRWWRSRYLKDIHDQIFTLENLYQIVINRMTELRNQEDLLILQDADIIGMTTTGAAKYRRVLQNIQPRIVVVEEAAEVLEAHIITTLSSGCQHLILIGDHQQLRPSTTVYELAKHFNLEVSMFERLIRMNVPYVRLNYQHRMRPEIAQLLTPHIYDKLENHESVKDFDNIKGVDTNLFFVDHDHLEEHIKEGKSHQNAHEAAFVKSLCLYFIQQGYAPSQITILTTYSGQLHCLQQKMTPKSKFEGVRVCVVDKYQGEENDIIILSLVRSNLVGQVGFLQIPNRVCVALSRAKKGLFCIGNMQLLSKVPLWSKINEVLKANGQIGRKMKLLCENHPTNVSYVSTSEDFMAVPEGGCMIPCEYRLNCGHVCILQCHPYDLEHKNYLCKKPCPKILCENGHKCKKNCSDPCGNCHELIPRRIEKCGHIQHVPCSMSPENFKCKDQCTNILQCGHKCVRICSETCTRNCPEKITVTLECGHTTKTLCYLKSESEQTGSKLKCNEKCEEKLLCGHHCPGTCGSCLERGSHLNCTKQCNNILLCSHRCEEKCLSDCFCIRACENKCIHGKCSSKCSELCPPCTKNCEWKCKHEKCTKLCWELCDRKACNKPCMEKLKCKHTCIGLCGEPCPTKCRICDADEVTECVFGKEADPQARFVQLMDCSHIFEVTKFSEWMHQEEPDQVIKLKSCPKCSTTIRQSFRYGNLIKQTISDIETVKEKIICKWLTRLEVFLSENDSVLSYFPGAIQTMQKLHESKINLRALVLLNEKIKFWIKLGAIKSKLQQVPELKNNVSKYIDTVSDKITQATSKYTILENHYELFMYALQVEALFPHQNIPVSCVKSVKDLFMQMKNHTITLEEVRARLKKFPVQMELLQFIQDKESILDTELLLYGLWHKCYAGHIYCSNKNEQDILYCPQCQNDEDSGDNDDDDVDDEEEDDDDN
ncbi:NFX1-type zinc finger-containing protein 1-like [Rhinophrynus dorsalis]